MKNNATVDLINSELKKHGLNDYHDPIFRCVFSDDQTEKRKGTFSEFCGKIFIRSYTGIKEVQKYPWIKKRWIIERWASGSSAFHPDLDTDRNGVYICVYVFQDVNLNYLPPLLKVAEIVVHQLLNPIGKSKMMNRDIESDKKNDELELNEIELGLKIESDKVRTKDPKSMRETSSSGRTSYLVDTEL